MDSGGSFLGTQICPPTGRLKKLEKSLKFITSKFSIHFIKANAFYETLGVTDLLNGIYLSCVFKIIKRLLILKIVKNVVIMNDAFRRFVNNFYKKMKITQKT